MTQTAFPADSASPIPHAALDGASFVAAPPAVSPAVSAVALALYVSRRTSLWSRHLDAKAAYDALCDARRLYFVATVQRLGQDGAVQSMVCCHDGGDVELGGRVFEARQKAQRLEAEYLAMEDMAMEAELARAELAAVLVSHVVSLDRSMADWRSFLFGQVITMGQCERLGCAAIEDMIAEAYVLHTA